MSDQKTIKSAKGKKTIKTNNVKSAKRINLKQQMFIDNYTNIDNPKTFGNGTQSVQAVYKYNKNTVAAVQASNLLKNTNIISEIEQNILELGMGSKVRLNAIKDVIQGKYIQQVVTTSRDKEGNEYTSTTERPPTASEVLKAVDLTEKITGTYDKNRVKADAMSADLKSIVKRHREELTGSKGGEKGSGRV